jgi:hypothetical protein
LRHYDARIKDRGLTLLDLADCVVHLTNGFKHHSRDDKHLQALLASLKGLVGRVVGGGQKG